MSKLHRMQFGRKSEKLARQIEQLELRLVVELQSNIFRYQFASLNMDGAGRFFSALNPEHHKNTLYR